MGDDEIDIRAFFGVLHRQFRLIAITIVLIVGAAGLALFTLTPIYTATALVMVDPSPKNLLDPDSQANSSASDSARVEGEVVLVHSDNVLMNVIENLHLVSDDEFGVRLGLTSKILAMLRLKDATLPTGSEALSRVLHKLQSAISVQRRGMTYLISVQASSEDPEQAAKLANAVTQAYIKDQLASKVASTLASRDILQARVEQARQAIVTSEGSFDGFISSNIDRIVNESGNTQIANLRNQIDSIKKEREQSLLTATILQQGITAGNWNQLATTLASDALKELEQQREQLAGTLASATDGSADAVDLRAQLKAIDAKLHDTATSELTALQSTITDRQNRENQLRETIRNSVLSSNLPTGVLTQIYELQKSADIARTQYETLLARAQNLTAQADLQIADSRVVSPALVPASPSFPNPKLILALSAIAALGVGIGLAFLYENFIGGFSSEEQVESVLGLKVVSSLPRVKHKGADQTSFAQLMITAPISAFSEAVRRARASIDRITRGGAVTGQGTVVMVSSTAPGEGKTTMALSLTRSYALSGKSALLIDCDLRKPSVHQQLGIEPSIGFVDYLNAEADNAINIQSITSKDPLSPATIIVGARRSSVPTDQLIAGAAFQQLLNAARRSFDVVILDTPPLGPVVDGLYISQHVDAVIYVVLYSSTSQTEARKALANLMAAKPEATEILAVLNQQDISQQAYNARYGSYYSQD